MPDSYSVITSQLQGGLGNQMFQIAAATALGHRHGVETVFNFKNHYLPLQGRKAKNYQNSVFSRLKIDDELIVSNVYREVGHSFSDISYTSGSLCLLGYFQSEKYFLNFSKQIRELFSCTAEIESYLNKKYNSIFEKKTTSIHIRRGDYLKFSDVHPSCGKEYYTKAMEIADADLYVIFSDDPLWCSDNFKGSKFLVVDGEEDYTDMYLMSKCNNNIIANSSFSWWSAWLNNNENKVVIAPKKWFGDRGPQDYHDIVPSDWERI